MKKFLITGASVRSKGAEAMVFETYKKIMEIDPDNKVSLLSTNPEYDMSFINKVSEPIDIDVLDGLSPGFVKNRYLNFGVTKLIKVRDLLSMVLNRVFLRHSNWQIGYKSPQFKHIAACDCVLQIAGISFSKDFGRFSAFGWAEQMLIARIMGKKYFCMPQSMGPSDDWFINLCAKYGLNNVTYIMPRGDKSIEYLEKLNLRNSRVLFVPDLAFAFDNPCEEEDRKIYSRYGLDPAKKYVAVVFNTHLYNWGGMPMVRMISTIIDNMIESYGYTVILIAHEVNDKNRVDDRYVNNVIFDHCKNKSNLLNVQDDLRANEIKSLLKCCDFTLCSRFHGMVSSLKVGVVPIVIGWADKYFEIMKLFDLEDLVVDYSRSSIEDIEERISYVISHNSELKEQIQSFLPQYENSSEIMKGIVVNNI